MDKPNILLVEDDVDIMKTNCRILSSQGCSVTEAFCGQEALQKMRVDSYDLVVLDMLLPDSDGLELCSTIREFTNVPILFLTCMNDVELKVRALQAGGDDYLTKPYDMGEFCARIHTLLRRSKPSREPHMLSYPPLTIHLNSQRAYLDGEDLFLTPKEYQVLLLLVRKIYRLISAEELCNALWEDTSIESAHTLYVHISSLRKKLKIDQHSRIQLKTIRGKGYSFIYYE